MHLKLFEMTHKEIELLVVDMKTNSNIVTDVDERYVVERKMDSVNSQTELP